MTRRRRQPDVYSDRRTGPYISGRSGIRLRCGAVVAGTIIGSRASELVAPGRHSDWCTHLAAVADGTRAALWHDGGRRHEQRVSFLLRPADNRGVRLPAPHRTGLRQPQPCLVVKQVPSFSSRRCSRAGRGSRHGQRFLPRSLAASSLPTSSTRLFCITTSYKRDVMAPHRARGGYVGYGLLVSFRVRNKRGMIPAVRETSGRIRAGSSTNSLAGGGGLRSRERARYVPDRVAGRGLSRTRQRAALRGLAWGHPDPCLGEDPGARRPSGCSWRHCRNDVP